MSRPPIGRSPRKIISISADLDVLSAIDEVRTVSRSQFLMDLAISHPLVRRALQDDGPVLIPPVPHHTTTIKTPAAKAHKTPKRSKPMASEPICQHQYTWKGYAKVCTECGDVKARR